MKIAVPMKAFTEERAPLLTGCLIPPAAERLLAIVRFPARGASPAEQMSGDWRATLPASQSRKFLKAKPTPKSAARRAPMTFCRSSLLLPVTRTCRS